jgi:hypothetical protein
MKILRPRQGYRSTPPDRRKKFLERASRSHQGKKDIQTPVRKSELNSGVLIPYNGCKIMFEHTLIMTKDKVIIAAMAAGDLNSLTPVQIQKLLFLLDKRAAAKLGGPFFNFEPYHYGPFDREIYDQLDAFAQNGLIEIVGTPYSRARS